MEKRMKVGLFIPCYVNAVYPQVGRASYELLRKVGCEVEYPLDQTCCGQPMANAGFEKDAKALAERMNALFEKYDYVVGPSASCVVFVREGYPRLLDNYREHACVDARIWEICEFLHDVVKPARLDARFPHRVSLHNSCHGVRKMGLSVAQRDERAPSVETPRPAGAGRGRRGHGARAAGRVLRLRRDVLRRGERRVGGYGAR